MPGGLLNPSLEGPLSLTWDLHGRRSARFSSLLARKHLQKDTPVTPPPRPQGRAGSTFVCTMPGLWSLRCSRVAAISISFAPTTNNTHRWGWAQTGPALAVTRLRQAPLGLRGQFRMMTLMPQPASGQLPGLCSSRKTRRGSFHQHSFRNVGLRHCCQMPI